MKKWVGWMLDGYVTLLAIFATITLFNVIKPDDAVTSGGFYFIVLVLLFCIFMFGMIVGTRIANWRNAKITEAAFKEFGEHVVNDVWNIFVTEFTRRFKEHYLEESSQQLAKLKEQVYGEFADLQQTIARNNLFPWQKSRPNKRDRDKIIWEMRNSNHTWEEIAKKANCGVSTAKESYDRMLKSGKLSS